MIECVESGLQCASDLVKLQNKFFILTFMVVFLFVLMQFIIVTFTTRSKGVAFWIGVVLLDFLVLFSLVVIWFFAPQIYVNLGIV